MNLNKIQKYFIFNRTHCSTESHKNLRAKTIRIGNIRWPPPLNSITNRQRSPLLHSSVQIKNLFIF
jgi:hypothetical protein